MPQHSPRRLFCLAVLALPILVAAPPLRAQAAADPSGADPGPAVTTPATASSAAVQDAPPPSNTPSTGNPAPVLPRHHAQARDARQTLDQRIAVLSKNLELTEPQRTALKRILVERQQQALRIRNSDAPGDVRIGQIRALQDWTVEKIRSILTEEQKKKYDPMLARKAPPSDAPQRSVEDWMKLTTPH